MAPERAASGSGQAPQDDREERLQHHCLDLANTLFKAHYMKDVYLKCSDDVSVPVHKFVLGAQSEYFKTQFFKRGLDNVSANSVVNRMYRFHLGSSACLNAMLAFAYTGTIPDLEGKAPRVHPLPAHVEPLFEIALECPTVCPEGLAEYITAKVLAHPVPSPKAAVAWLHFACWQVPKDAGVNQSVLDRIRATMLAALRALPFSPDMFLIDTPAERVAHHTVVAYILVSVQLQATEVEVCRAVARWADVVNAERHADSAADVELATGRSDGSGAASQALEPLPGVELVKSKLDLSFASSHDIYNTIKPLGLFSLAQLIQTVRQRVKTDGTDTTKTSINTNRGAKTA